MKYTLAIIFLNLFLLSNIFAQEVQFFVGYRFESAVSTVLSLDDDSVLFYEENHNHTYTPLGITVDIPLTKRFNFQTGLLYYSAGTNYAASKKNENFLKQTTKISLVYYPTLEFSQLLTFDMFESGIWKLTIMGGITPAVRILKRGSKFHKSTQPQWEQEVIDVLNARPSTVKRTYVNYSYGISVKCGRFGLGALWHQNLSKNIAKPLKVWGEEHFFKRNTGSLTFNLNFTFYRFEKNDG